MWMVEAGYKGRELDDNLELLDAVREGGLAQLTGWRLYWEEEEEEEEGRGGGGGGGGGGRGRAGGRGVRFHPWFSSMSSCSPGSWLYFFCVVSCQLNLTHHALELFCAPR